MGPSMSSELEHNACPMLLKEETPSEEVELEERRESNKLRKLKTPTGPL